jgi:hypothetical protein
MFHMENSETGQLINPSWIGLVEVAVERCTSFDVV